MATATVNNLLLARERGYAGPAEIELPRGWEQVTQGNAQAGDQVLTLASGGFRGIAPADIGADWNRFFVLTRRVAPARLAMPANCRQIQPIPGERLRVLQGDWVQATPDAPWERANRGMAGVNLLDVYAVARETPPIPEGWTPRQTGRVMRGDRVWRLDWGWMPAGAGECRTHVDNFLGVICRAARPSARQERLSQEYQEPSEAEISEAVARLNAASPEEIRREQEAAAADEPAVEVLFRELDQYRAENAAREPGDRPSPPAGYTLLPGNARLRAGDLVMASAGGTWEGSFISRQRADRYYAACRPSPRRVFLQAAGHSVEIPDGHEWVQTGVVQFGDRCWSNRERRWFSVTEAAVRTRYPVYNYVGGGVARPVESAMESLIAAELEEDDRRSRRDRRPRRGRAEPEPDPDARIPELAQARIPEHRHRVLDIPLDPEPAQEAPQAADAAAEAPTEALPAEAALRAAPQVSRETYEAFAEFLNTLSEPPRASSPIARVVAQIRGASDVEVLARQLMEQWRHTQRGILAMAETLLQILDKQSRPPAEE